MIEHVSRERVIIVVVPVYLLRKALILYRHLELVFVPLHVLLKPCKDTSVFFKLVRVVVKLNRELSGLIIVVRLCKLL